ncbi:hypothetical protein [Geodermatophilus marinus]|uniref:hypothetical protein n=1 Tax=Geodermatophilus sp. LHW52908 TaxID=2303986 RepID=UPI0013144771|nr:hypothetical protein [Geodermatophilus sp. LHW52908]
MSTLDVRQPDPPDPPGLPDPATPDDDGYSLAFAVGALALTAGVLMALVVLAWLLGAP